ncbi:MAG TPA: hypothetical protein VEK07_19125 [Polyangiaceae bacterium]|nr:hypothetical protein [Polyangiaceae bacterium]
MNAVETPVIAVESPSSPSPAPALGPIEIGVGSFLLSGPGASGVVGLSVFLFDEIADNLYLRPSVAAGEAPASNAGSTWAAGRLDACTRVPGNYRVDQGLQLDLCGGTDVGLTYFASGTQTGQPAQGRTLPYWDLGPSLALRGELGDRGGAVWLRAFGGINVLRPGFEDSQGTRQTPPPASFRLELGFSWGR